MITSYHRPGTLDEAVALVAAPGTRVIVEGTALTSSVSDEVSAAVDLQSLGLDGIEMAGESLVIGSMTTLADLSTSPRVPVIISDLANREAPSTIRTLATVGGTVATNDHESELLAGLLAFDALVTVAQTDVTANHPLGSVLDNPQLIEGSIITKISFDPRGAASAQRTGRTPMDRPIVMVVGHRGTNGHIHLAITGMGTHVVALSPGETGLLEPSSDFRGSSRYRKELATVLTKRVLADLSGGGSE
jgi:CO/xanthine dehydrogenase FAD-binding subunit